MRFCMVTTFYPPYNFGGDGLYVRALARLLVEAGHSVDVIHSIDAYTMGGGTARSAAPAPDDGVRVEGLSSTPLWLDPLISHQTGRPGRIGPLLKARLDRSYDVVNFHNISLIGGPGVLRYSKAPVTLYTLHEHWLLCPTHIFWKNKREACTRRTCFTCTIRSGRPPQLWRYTGLRSAALESVDRLIAPSQFTADLHRREGITRPIETIGLFPSVAGAGATDDRPDTFLYVGRITEPKGVRQLVSTFRAMPSAKLALIGEGDLRARLQAECRDAPNIRFIGALPQERLAEWYGKAVAIVVPSLVPETFGLVLVEAAASGVPAIVHRASGGAAEVAGQLGGLIYDDGPGLSQAIDLVMRDGALRDRLGARARTAQQSLFTAERHLDRYLQCIESVRGNRSDAA